MSAASIRSTVTTLRSVPIPAGPHGWSRIATLLLASAVLTLAGCGGDSDITLTTTDSAIENNERTTGDPAVYARIEALTSCTALQREFDIAMDNAEAREPGDSERDISLSYGSAANTRMREVGCYG